MFIKSKTSAEKLAEIARKNRQEIIEAKLTRREMIKLGLLTTNGLLVASSGLTSRDAKAARLVSPKTTPWLDPLPILPIAKPIDIEASDFFRKYPCNALNHQNNVFNEFAPKLYYHHKYTEAEHYFHSQLPKNKVWGWDGRFGGPTIMGHYGEPIVVRRTNTLNPNHVGYGNPLVTTHLHNAHNPSESDGNPEYYFHPGQYKDYHYPHVYAGFSVGESHSPPTAADPNGQPWQAQSTLWYHDHMADFTTQNVYRGLAGFHLLFNEYDSGDETDERSTAFRFPSGEFDIPLLFLDMQFDDQGERTFDLFESDGLLGDKITINGAIQPYHHVGRRKYRLRILNGGTARHYNFKFNNNLVFQVIATDGNVLPKPIGMTSVKLAPAERVDIIVDFGQLKLNQQVFLINTMEQVNGRGPTGKSLEKPDELLRFDIVRTDIETDSPPLPKEMYLLPPIPSRFKVLWDKNKKPHREFIFNRSGGQWAINGEIYNPEEPMVRLEKNTAEVWEFQGSGNWDHPIHAHFEELRILSRNGVKPSELESGRKDVVWLHPGEKVRIYNQFRDFEGQYVLHCHNYIHEDHAMMVRFDVGNPDLVSKDRVAGLDIEPDDFKKIVKGTLV